MGMFDTVVIAAGCPITYLDCYQSYDLGKVLDTVTIQKDGRLVSAEGRDMGETNCYARIGTGKRDYLLHIENGVVLAWRELEHHRDRCTRGKKFKPWTRRKKAKKGATQ